MKAGVHAAKKTFFPHAENANRVRRSTVKLDRYTVASKRAGAHLAVASTGV